MLRTTLLALSLAMSQALAAAPLSWKDISALPKPAVGERIAYGKAPQQFGELRLPKGKGPHPVAVLVHGGCWLAAYDYQYFNHLAAALADAGVASWTIEYRRLGDEGGGWPGTLLDVARATDHVRVLAGTHPLDVKRVVSIGHSAGGQLALWLGARHKLPAKSDLHLPNPLALKGAVGLAPISDLAGYRVGAPDSCNASVDRLLGGGPTQFPERYAQASPLALLPLGTPQWLIQGGADPIVPAASVSAYAAAAKKAGDAVTERGEAALGHFDPAVPGNALGDAAVRAVLDALR